jgi:exosortase/archaeosortase family protein
VADSRTKRGRESYPLLLKLTSGISTKVRKLGSRKNLRRLSQTNNNWLSQRLNNTHNRIILLGLLVGLCYLPVWLLELVKRATLGATTPLLVVAAVYFALQELWHQRKQLAQLVVYPKHRLLGHAFILAGVGLFPFCRFSFWSQASVWLTILAGIALSSWGVSFFKGYSRPLILLILSAHPRVDILFGHLWRAVAPQHSLERFMAWSGGLVLNTMGQQATTTDIFISLPKGSVEVLWGCSGFDMAITMAGTSLLLGLILNQSWQRIVGLVILGIALGLVFNVPRIVVLTLAAANWGEESFNFWHGFWGGQIFSSILFTAYYYLIMNFLPQRAFRSRG